mmetsp:Transcript_4854/g.11957  ORF Transcript_4854/g.11957 Transcript_4854/m.11957 type:complete len:237 (+) Transcript_4854:2560-3270(+)
MKFLTGLARRLPPDDPNDPGLYPRFTPRLEYAEEKPFFEDVLPSIPPLRGEPRGPPPPGGPSAAAPSCAAAPPPAPPAGGSGGHTIRTRAPFFLPVPGPFFLFRRWEPAYPSPRCVALGPRRPCSWSRRSLLVVAFEVGVPWLPASISRCCSSWSTRLCALSTPTPGAAVAAGGGGVLGLFASSGRSCSLLLSLMWSCERLCSFFSFLSFSLRCRSLSLISTKGTSVDTRSRDGGR